MMKRLMARVRVPGFIRRHKQAIETVAASAGINIAWRAIACVLAASAASAAIARTTASDSAASQLKIKQYEAMVDALAEIPAAPVATDLSTLPPNQRVEIRLLRHPLARFTNKTTRLTLRNTLAHCTQVGTSSSFACSLSHAGVKTYKATLDGPRR